MLKKTITYTDFNGNQLTEDFYFNLTKAEITELEVSYPGGLTARLQEIVDANDHKAMVETFKEIILRSYGVKSQDGKRFVKNETLKEEFYQSEAYSELFMELLSNENTCVAFMNGVVPQGTK